jgi:hypothetical protein
MSVRRLADLIPADGTAPKEDGLPYFKTDKERLGAPSRRSRALTADPRSLRGARG